MFWAKEFFKSKLLHAFLQYSSIFFVSEKDITSMTRKISFEDQRNRMTIWNGFFFLNENKKPPKRIGTACSKVQKEMYIQNCGNIKETFTHI